MQVVVEAQVLNRQIADDRPEGVRHDPDVRPGSSTTSISSDRSAEEKDGGWMKVAVLELANVAATIVSGGTWCPPTPVEKVTDRYGKDLPLNEKPCEQAAAPGVANSLAQGMSHDTTGSGTVAWAVRDTAWNRPAIDKTGTTEEHKSVAFLAATPQYTGAVMIYARGNRPEVICANPIRFCPGSKNGVFGGQVAAPAWFNAMKAIHEGLPVVPLPPASPKYR